jgi:hypothetical protein
MHAGAAETPGDGRGLHEGYAIFAGRSTAERRWPNRQAADGKAKAAGRSRQRRVPGMRLFPR